MDRFGDSTVSSRRSNAATVPNLSNITNIAAGQSYALAVDETGKMYGWGLNTSSQLGNNESINVRTPVEITRIIKCSKCYSWI